MRLWGHLYSEILGIDLYKLIGNSSFRDFPSHPTLKILLEKQVELVDVEEAVVGFDW